MPISTSVEEPAVQEWAVQQSLLLMLPPLLPSSTIVCNHNWLIRRCCLRLRHLRSQGLNDLLVDLSRDWGLLSDFFLGEFHTGTRFLTVLAEYTPTKKIPNNSEIPNQLTTNSMTLQAGSNSGPDPKKTYIHPQIIQISAPFNKQHSKTR